MQHLPKRTEDNIDIDELVESAETCAAETAVQEDSVSETQAEAAGEAERNLEHNVKAMLSENLCSTAFLLSEWTVRNHRLGHNLFFAHTARQQSKIHVRSQPQRIRPHPFRTFLELAANPAGQPPRRTDS